MKKCVLSIIIALIFQAVSSQVPQGVNYQAVARDESGNPVKNVSLDIKMGILSDTTTPVIVWEELHSDVITDASGVFSLVVGTGSQISGSVDSFYEIDWTYSTLFLRVQLYYQGTWKNMGSTKLWSVPYSMAAGELTGSVSKLAVAGETNDMEEALFEVKNKNGQTVFAVYNEGVRIYVDDGDTDLKGAKGGFAIGGFSLDKADKGSQNLFFVSSDSIRAYIGTESGGEKASKGGFAIGGFDMTKGLSEEYLRVTRDSTRVYLNNTGTKARKGGFAIGGFDLSKGGIQDYLNISQDSIRMYIDDSPDSKARKGGFAIGGFDMTKGGANFFNVETDTLGIINPSQNRILWYPLKNAFLTGKVLIEKPDSVGENSFSSGYESKAIGDWSQALGYQAVARNDYSTAIGYQAEANNINSFALGQWAKAMNEESYAFGRGAIAEGFRSFAFGSAGIDSSKVETGVAHAIGDYSFAFGQGSVASGLGSFTLGVADTASASYSTSLGYKTSASAASSTAMGNGTQASGYASLATGNHTMASNAFSTATGYHTTASGRASSALGWETKASGDYSTAMGWLTESIGNFSTAMGSSTQAIGHSSAAFGRNSIASGNSSIAMGDVSIASGWASTAIGGGIASGNFSTAIGGGIDAKGESSVAIALNWQGGTIVSQPNTMVIMGGNVGIGTTTPGTRLSIAGLTGTTSGSYLRIYNNNIYYYSSSVKTKTDIEPLTEDYYKILKANPVSFTDKLSGERNIGFIAEDFDSLGLENLVIYNEGEPVSLSYELVSLYNLEIIKDQQQQIENQQKEIDELKALVNMLIADQKANVNN